MPRATINNDVKFTTGTLDEVILKKGTNIDVINALSRKVFVLSGQHRDRTGVLANNSYDISSVYLAKKHWSRVWVDQQFCDLSHGFREIILRYLEQSMMMHGKDLLSALEDGCNFLSKDAPVNADNNGIRKCRDVVKKNIQDSSISNYIIAFRFYSGDTETLRPPRDQKLFKIRKTTQKSKMPVRHKSEQVFNPSSMLRKKMSSKVSSSKSQDMAHSHQEGDQDNSVFVSLGSSLPRLLRTPSYKVRVIMFGHSSGVGDIAGYKQATHLGVFLVPKLKLGPIIWKTGEMALFEREITYKGSGLEGFKLFTVRNPFHPGSGFREVPPNI